MKRASYFQAIAPRPVVNAPGGIPAMRPPPLLFRPGPAAVEFVEISAPGRTAPGPAVAAGKTPKAALPQPAGSFASTAMPQLPGARRAQARPAMVPVAGAPRVNPPAPQPASQPGMAPLAPPLISPGHAAPAAARAAPEPVQARITAVLEDRTRQPPPVTAVTGPPRETPVPPHVIVQKAMPPLMTPEPPEPPPPRLPAAVPARGHSAPGLHIGTLEVRVAAPAPLAAPPPARPPARTARSPARQGAPLARGFGVFGLGQS